jgi:hypothetical protein
MPNPLMHLRATLSARWSRVSTTADSLPDDLESLRALAAQAIAERDVAMAEGEAAHSEGKLHSGTAHQKSGVYAVGIAASVPKRCGFSAQAVSGQLPMRRRQVIDPDQSVVKTTGSSTVNLTCNPFLVVSWSTRRATPRAAVLFARRCVTISIACERMEGEAALGNEIDLDAYGTLTDRLGRALQRLGLKRRPRDVTPPDPLEYAREHSP